MAAQRHNRVAIGIALLALLAAALYDLTHFDLTTDIGAFLPSDREIDQQLLVRQVAEGQLGRTMVLLLEGKDADQVADASRAFEAALRAQPAIEQELAFLEAGPAEGFERAVYDLYHPRRLGFAASDAEGARQAISDAGLKEAASELKRRLQQPMSLLLGRLAPSDPLLILPHLFEHLEQGQTEGLSVHDGRFVSADKRHAVLLLGTKSSALDSAAQGPVLAAIQAAFAQTAPGFEGLSLQQSGVNRFAVRTERAIKSDIQRVSVLSVVGLCAILALVFRSPRLLFLASIPLGAGMVFAIAASLLVYGRVHGVTLAFGASLMGVTLDYVVHLYCHHVVARHPEGAQASVRSVRPALLTGGVTTLTGFVALAGAGFRGLQEVALFSSVGITTALAATLLLLPPLLERNPAPVPTRDRLAEKLDRVLAALAQRRAALGGLLALASALAVWGVATAELGDGLMGMDRLDPELLAEDQRVRDHVARFEQRRFVVATAQDEASALQLNDRVAAALREAEAQGEVEGWTNVASLLPSPATQASVASVLQSDASLPRRFRAAFEAEGFRSALFAPFLDTLAGPPPTPLHFDQLLGSPLAPLVRSFRLQLDDSVAFVSWLRGVRDADALAARFDSIQGARLVQQDRTLAEANAAYQRRASELLAVGLLAVLLLLALRYRDLRATTASFVPSVVAAGCTLTALQAAGFAVDLVVLTALLMIVSMGVDYGVFLVDAQRGGKDHSPAALLSVLVAACSTVLGFGLLAFSEHPLLQSIGVAACAGMVACLLLAPATLALVHAPNTEHNP